MNTRNEKNAVNSEMCSQTRDKKTISVGVSKDKDNIHKFNGQQLFTPLSSHLKNDAVKRLLSDSYSSIVGTDMRTEQNVRSDSTPPAAGDHESKRPSAKKAKTGDPEKVFGVAQIEIDDYIVAMFTVFFENLRQLIIETYDKKYYDSPLLAKKYTLNIHALIVIFKEVYPYVTGRPLKTRITKIKNALKRKLEIPTDFSTTEVDTSDGSETGL